MVREKPHEAERTLPQFPTCVPWGMGEETATTQKDGSVLRGEQISFWERRELSEKRLKVQGILRMTDSIAEDTLEGFEW